MQPLYSQTPSTPLQSPLAQPSPLDQLADIHLPDGVSWWPLAPGWWILLALVVALALAFYQWRRRKAQNNYRRSALQQLDRIYADFQLTHNSANYLQALSMLLRRTALTAYPHSFNASIKGEEWLHWLDAVCPRLDEKFSSEMGQGLLISAYQKNPQVDAERLKEACAAWISHHRNHRQKIPDVKKVAPAAESHHV
jgi:hypothetical protein